MEHGFKNQFESLVRLRVDYNDALRRTGKKSCFITTDTTLKTILDMEDPTTEVKFGAFIIQLEKIMFESSRYGKNLPNNSELKTIINDINQLRHEYGHDRLVGKEGEVLKKQMKVGLILKKYMGKINPRNEDFLILSIKLLENLIRVMTDIIDNVENGDIDDTKRVFINVMYNPKLRKDVIQKKLLKKGEFEHLAVSPIFVPNLFWPPEIRSENECVYIPIDISLRDHSISGVKKFISIVHNFWKYSLSDIMYTMPLFSWSISDSTTMVFGVGEESLYKNLKKLTRSVLTIALSGEYGKELTAFLVVFGMDFRNDFASHCFVDYYLSNIPLDTHWLETFRNILDEVASYIDGGDSCLYYKTAFKRWESSNIDLPINSLNTLMGKNESGIFQYYDYGVYKTNLVPQWNLMDEWGDSYLSNSPFDNLEEMVGFLAPALLDEDFKNNDLRIKRITISQFNVPGRGYTIPILFGKITLN